jgi:hypothetical protein
LALTVPLDFRDAEMVPAYGPVHPEYSAFKTASPIARVTTRSQPGSQMSPVRNPRAFSQSPRRYPLPIFFVNVNRFTLVGQMGSDDANREASQGPAKRPSADGIIRSTRDFGETSWKRAKSSNLAVIDCRRRLAAEGDSVIANDVDAHWWGLLLASAKRRR